MQLAGDGLGEGGGGGPISQALHDVIATHLRGNSPAFQWEGPQVRWREEQSGAEIHSQQLQTSVWLDVEQSGSAPACLGLSSTAVSCIDISDSGSQSGV